MEALTAMVVARRLSQKQISFAPSSSSEAVDGLGEAIACGLLHVYLVRRHDWQEIRILAAYFPEKHALYLLYNGRSETARNIPDLGLGLFWWVERPEIWREHVGEMDARE
jgi:hypothetical protein